MSPLVSPTWNQIESAVGSHLNMKLEASQLLDIWKRTMDLKTESQTDIFQMTVWGPISTVPADNS